MGSGGSVPAKRTGPRAERGVHVLNKRKLPKRIRHMSHVVQGNRASKPDAERPGLPMLAAAALKGDADDAPVVKNLASITEEDDRSTVTSGSLIVSDVIDEQPWHCVQEP
mmetsp:Transcript_98041/g.169911  ORF Transcript_98041/g.169911 Transcript_98041/m.169911 type:complete len:110 (+) Transcript_98041:83-412(+)